MKRAALAFISGYENVHTRGGSDVFTRMRHYEHMEADIRLAAETNLKQVRYPIPWHEIERELGIYDWSIPDRALAEFRRLGIDVIADLLHHISYPEWLRRGMADPDFIEKFRAFVLAFATRYPWIEWYTIINEPYITVTLCTEMPAWDPARVLGKEYVCSKEPFIPMLMQVAKATCLVAEDLVKLNDKVRFLHIDTCEHHSALSSRMQRNAEFFNERRFLHHDLVFGRVGSSHKLYKYLLNNGADSEDLKWLENHGLDMSRVLLGLDYYPQSESLHTEEGMLKSPDPIGFAAIARQYVDRFGLPIGLTETNIRGFTERDEISWLKHMLEQVEELIAEGIDIRLFCWFPLIDSVDWDSMLNENAACPDGQGLYELTSDLEGRIRGELAWIYAELAAGRMTSKDIPAYAFDIRVLEFLQSYLKFMKHWQWEEKDPNVQCMPIL